MIAIASDHAGYPQKQKIIEYLKKKKIEYMDLGTNSLDSVDYPVYAKKVINAISTTACDRGILVCGSGIGMSIAVNRSPFVRGALCYSAAAAKLSREHNDANVLVLPGRKFSAGKAIRCVDVFLNTAFLGERHAVRVQMLGELFGDADKAKSPAKKTGATKVKK